MRRILLLTACLGLGNYVSAQTPAFCPSNSTAGADDCQNACILCNLHNYTGQTNGYTASGTAAFCGPVENDQWLGFRAATDSVQFTIKPRACVQHNGLQAAIYASCTAPPLICHSGQSGGDTTAISLKAHTVPGQHYFLRIDGYAGDQCQFTIQVSPDTATTVVPSASLGLLAGPAFALPGAQVVYSVDSVPGTLTYTWTAPADALINGLSTPATLGANTGYRVTVTFGIQSGVVRCTRSGAGCPGMSSTSRPVYISAGGPVTLPPPCQGGTQAAEDCASVCISCDFIGYTGNTGGFSAGNVPHFCGQVENDQWLGFVAEYATNTITVTPSNCQHGDGVEVALYGGCGADYLACQSGQSGNGNVPATITAALIPGSNYYLMVDGFNGDVCDFTISLNPPHILIVDPLDPTGPIQGPAQACPFATVNYQIPIVSYASAYVWTGPPGSTINGLLSPVTLGGPNGSVATVTLAQSSGSVCVRPVNSCYAGMSACRPVDVVPLPPTTLPRITVCAEDLPYSLPWGQQIYASGDYFNVYNSYLGCDSVVQVQAVVKPPIATHLPNKVICAGNCVSICGEDFCETGFISKKCTSYSGCDSIVTQQLTILHPVAEILGGNTLSCGNSLLLSSAPSQNGTTKKWTHDGVNFASSVNTITVYEAGTYVLTASQTLGGITCTASDTMAVVSNTPPGVGPPVITDIQVINDQSGQGLGAIDITISSVLTYTVAWFSNGQLIATTEDIGSLMAGMYEVSVTTPEGCSATASVTVENVTQRSGPLPPPCGNGTEPGEDCGTTCISCNFNGYQGTTAGFLPGTVPSFCSQIQNDQWIGFIASSSSAVITVLPANCMNGNGIQVALYGGCEESFIACNMGANGNGTTPTSITAPFVPGTNYYLLIDGFGGDVCDFTISINPPQSGLALPVGAVGAVQGPASACPGAEPVQYSVPAVTNAGAYTWTAPPGSLVNGAVPPLTLGAPTGRTVEITFGSAGGSVCVEVANPVRPEEWRVARYKSCPIPPTNLPEAIVCAEDLPYSLPWGAQVSISGLYSITYTSYQGCDSLVQQQVIIEPAIVTHLPEQVICAGTCVTICGETFCETGLLNVQCTSYLGCDSTVVGQLTVLNPRATIIAPDTLLNCVHPTLILQSDSSAPTSIKQWKKIDGTLLGDQVDSITVTQPDTIVLITTQQRAGVFCAQSDTVVIQANFSPVSAMATVSDTLSCSQPSAQLNGSSNVPGALYVWTGPNGFTSIKDTVLVGVPGLYSLVVTHPISGCKDTVTIQVVATGSLPAVNAIPSNNGVISCQVTSIHISTTTTAVAPSLAWMGPGGFTSNLPEPTVHLAGEYSLTVTAGNTGCLAFTMVTVTIDTVSPTITATGGTLSCVQGFVQLAALTSAILPSFSWEGPGGFSSNLASPIINAPGSYEVTVTNAANGCTASATAEVFSDIQLPDVAATGGTLDCDSTLQLHGSSSTSNVTYMWTGGNGEFFTGPDPIVSQPGIYTLVVTAANGCTNSAVAVAEAAVNTPMISMLQVTNDQNGAGVGAIQITVTGVPVYLVRWFLNGQLIATTEDISGLMAGTYTVVLTTVDGSCTIAATAVVDNVVATVEPFTSTWKLVPNPAHDFVEIQHSGLEASQAQLILFDILGRKIWTKNLAGNSNGLRLETRDLPAGLYQITVQDVHSIVVLPLVIQH